jgi:hypothetical protein
METLPINELKRITTNCGYANLNLHRRETSNVLIASASMMGAANPDSAQNITECVKTI